MIDRDKLMNAFQPATELDDPERFAGRSRQVRELSDSLRGTGTVPLIFGDRGLGKSSLALQIRRIAMGDVELLNLLGAERLALSPDRFYLTFYLTCTDATRTFAELLQAMVNAAESVEIKSDDASYAGTLVDRTTRRQLSFKVFKLESTTRYQTESQRLSYQDLNLEEKLVQLCDLLTGTYGQPVLFIVDELDRMTDTQGLASFLKSASSDELKVLLVGIAGHVGDLLRDHQSLERKLLPVRLPVMSESELVEIVRKAEHFLEENDIHIKFDSGAVKSLAGMAAGFPWFVHVLGQQALIYVDSESRDTVTAHDIETAKQRIVQNTFAQQFADMYQMAVRDSYNREMTLRAFAAWRGPDIPTGEIYRFLKPLGINGGSTYRAHLCQSEYGGILFVPTIQKRGLIRFRNEMFKAYVRMRPSIYADVDQKIDEAWKRRP